jgi:hypothetical protein
VVEENLEGEEGRLSRLDDSGNRTIVCTGFDKIEDVVVDEDGSIYVSEDGTGWVIQMRTSSGTVTPPPDQPDQSIWLPLILRL